MLQRTLLLAAIAPPPAAAAGTICSLVPSACDGTYTGTQLNLNRKSLSGTIATQLGALTQLTLLGLSWNSLSGSIPTQCAASSSHYSVHTLGSPLFTHTSVFTPLCSHLSRRPSQLSLPASLQ